MNRKQSEFRKRLIATFMVESEEHFKAIASGLVALEKGFSSEVMEVVFRAAHSLKGASRAVNIPGVEVICQAMEGVFSVWKKGALPESAHSYDALYRAIDVMREVLVNDETAAEDSNKRRVSEIVHTLSAMESGAMIKERDEVIAPPGYARVDAPSPPLSQTSAPFDAAAQTDTVRISAARMSELLIQAEEMLITKFASSKHATGLQDLSSMLAVLKNEMGKAYIDILPAVSADTEGGRARLGGEDESAASRALEFLKWSDTYIKQMEGIFAREIKSARAGAKIFDRMLDNLLGGIKEATVLPFSTLLESFPMLVRNISRQQGKEITLEIHGEGIEIDKRILEEMKDPLIHIVRNCIDHGIEPPDARLKANKPRRGTITISIFHIGGGRVELTVGDDGCGIDAGKVKQTAVKHGILASADFERLTDKEALALIFHSGFSTSPIITDISGRGIGLAIVQEKAEKLGGSVSVDTVPGASTLFRMVLPLTMATFRGILVSAGADVFALPTANVERTVRIRNDEIKTIENKETVVVKGVSISFVRLSSVLELSDAPRRQGSVYTSVVVINAEDRRIAVGVDDIVSEQELLVKGLGPQLARVRNVTGAAMLGTGKPVPVLNVQDLMRSAVKAPSHGEYGKAAPVMAVDKKILVAEDSITSRTLIRHILESAGYGVKTAVDGLDAITQLKTEKFDLVVSDIEMPRMSGFELTMKIRSDKKYEDLPIVLVTGLETREDREKGIAVGANAYIVKSSFSQSNLLDAIKKLV